MFVDELTIHARAGKGGDGVVLWLHEKGKEYSGPAGGNGGKGGDVFVRAIRDLGRLSEYRHVKMFRAGEGESGRRDGEQGGGGEDCVIDLPIGSRVENLETRRKVQLLVEGQTEKILNGGRGGLGNKHFKSSRNTRPTESTQGVGGEEADFFIELELVADIGLIGLPNAGKSSLLNVLTNARAKVGDFRFTTLEPNLGNFHGSILADIPGLIEGAAQGKGLGHRFLRHIRRTRILCHCISLEEDVATSYQTIRSELASYDSELLQKPEVIILTKRDLVSETDYEQKRDTLASFLRESISVSLHDESSLKELKTFLSRLLTREKGEGVL